MKCRALGRTGIAVSEVGFGSWGIGGRTAGATSYGQTDDKTSVAALEAALEQGINFFDTANVYGDGHSEELLGAVFRKRRDRVVIATKVGFTNFQSPPDFKPAVLRKTLAGSLRRLNTDYVDVLQLHNPSMDELRTRPEILECLEGMRAEGLIRAYGLSLKKPEDGLAAIAEFDVAVLQVNLNMLDLRACDCGLLSAASEAGTGIIARTPLNFGFLGGAVDETTRFPSEDHRSIWPREQIERWARAARLLRARIPAYRNDAPSTVAIRFCLSFPAVSSVIPGMITPEEVHANASASIGGPLSPDELDSVSDIHRTEAAFVARPAGEG